MQCRSPQTSKRKSIGHVPFEGETNSRHVMSYRFQHSEISVKDDVRMLKKYISRKMNIPTEDMSLVDGDGQALKDAFVMGDCGLQAYQ